MPRTDSRTARRLALLTLGVALAVIASTAGAGIIPGSILAPHDGGDGDSLPDTDDYDDPLVDYDAVDYELALNSTAQDDLNYSLTVLGAVEPVDDAANGTVDCAEQVCRVEGTLGPDETATYHVSGSIVGVQPKDGLVGHINGTFEGDALVGTGTGALSPNASADEPAETDAGDERSDDAGRDVPADTTGPEDPGDNGGEEPEDPPETQTYSFNVTGRNVVGDDPDEEYVTLNNTGESAVEMTDWTLRDREDGGRVGTNLDPFVFPDEFTLNAGEEVTIWSGEGENDESDLYWNTDVNIWNQTGDTIILRTEDGETVLRHSYPDQTVPNGSNGTDPVVSNVTYEDCSTVTIEGEGEYAVEVNTEFYGADGLTSQNYEDEVTLPTTINVSGIDDGAVTDVAIEQTTVLDGDGGVAAAQTNPDFDGCRDEIDAQYEDWQDGRDGNDNESDDGNGDNESDGGGATADDISISYEGCSTVSIDVEGDASDDDWEIWEVSTRFFTESGLDTMILEPDDGIPTTIDANERVDGAVTDVEIEHVMVTGDGGETFVEASQPDGSCGEQINQQWEEYQDETSDGSDQEATDGEEDDEDNENADAGERGGEADAENDEASGDGEETGDESDDADATEEEDADEDDGSGDGADENGEPAEDTGGEETSNGADEDDAEADGEEADSAASSDEEAEDESIESETEATNGNASD
ncbi:lamin tail domain-containing protein [Natronoarchaeum mannanilyticum]|uniref:LTD domain-containing protein n=1 Tax=Natronoarchaeum mannanilyticum TaxID=926360 RepID=A0AAV3TBY5_9EURY